MTDAHRLIQTIVSDLAAHKALPTPTYTTQEERAVWLAYLNRIDALRAELAAAVAAQNPTISVTVGGETREVPVKWSGHVAFSAQIVHVRVGRSGSKLWPSALHFGVTDSGKVSAPRASRIMGKETYLVCWSDKQIAEKHISASIHSNSEGGAKARAKSSTTRKNNTSTETK